MVKELKERMKEALANGLSKSGLLALERITNETKSVFGTRLGSGGLARIPPMKIDWN